MYSGVQGKNNAYHNINKVQNSFIDALILNLIDIVVNVVFSLYSSISIMQKILSLKANLGWPTLLNIKTQKETKKIRIKSL
jgi:hypothetical protein